MDTANDFAIALEKSSLEAIGLDFAKLTKEQLELYRSRRILEHNAWVKLIEDRDTTARAEALREAGRRFDVEASFIELDKHSRALLRSAILADTQEPK